MPRKNPTPADNRRMAVVRLPPELLTQLDVFCKTQRLHPSRTRVIEAAIREFLQREQQAETASPAF